MRDSTLDDLLADWHNWSAGYCTVPVSGACSMFKAAKSPRHWDTTGDIDDALIHKSTMDALDFAILGDARGQGGMVEPYRAAITCHARNLVAKVAVWSNPRLPASQIERVELVNQAINILQAKLKSAGIL